MAALSGTKVLKRGILVLALLIFPEVSFWLAAKAAQNRPAPGDCAVLVLGFPTRSDGSPSALQRSRVETGVAIYREQRCELMALAGGSPHSPFVEAETMAKLALEAGIPQDKIWIEGRSRDTWENIAYSLPRLEKFPSVFLVSDPLHVLRAKRYWCRQRGDLCARAYPATRYRPLALYGYKWLGLAGEAASAVRDAFKKDRWGPRAIQR